MKALYKLTTNPALMSVETAELIIGKHSVSLVLLDVLLLVITTCNVTPKAMPCSVELHCF